MGIDAVALLRIPNLPAPKTDFGAEHFVQHRGDATLLHTFARFEGAAPDEHALALRRLLGTALDAHDDPRGILFFPDAGEPDGEDYETIVRQVGDGGVWAPKVEADHVPARYTSAAPDSHEGLVARMIAVMGRDAATQLDLLAQVHLQLIELTEGRADAVAGYREQMDQLTRAMGAEVAGVYEKSLREKIAREQAAQAAHFARFR